MEEKDDLRDLVWIESNLLEDGTRFFPGHSNLLFASSISYRTDFADASSGH